MGKRPKEDFATFCASHRQARISARKVRLVIDMIRGDSVDSALTKLMFCEKRGAPMIRKVIESAVANATQEAGLEPESLVVHRAFVDEGQTLKRWRPRSMGRAFPRLKRTCHLSVILREGEKAAAPALAAEAEEAGANES